MELCKSCEYNSLLLKYNNTKSIILNSLIWTCINCNILNMKHYKANQSNQE